ncbi:hypothetical protein B0H67DRAFT_566231 [Lasiosphaeris hirsuta]|uniref:Uncharacterized protein n=1 Tax=Lasiosphaeris hirsuta TaxID=260670 RepID=A0AA40EC38_9PEZI|nr:hypothetical protein B0H67DRAFT_566231 [Lasiosphaeris hirsuta]
MLLTILIPGAILGQAAAHFYSARENLRQLRRRAEEDGVEWTIAHTYFSDMGGFVLRYRKQPGCLRRIWAHEVSCFVRNPELG